jgi:hypothetical protein
VKSAPRLLHTFALPPSFRTMTRKPSCLTSCSQPRRQGANSLGDSRKPVREVRAVPGPKLHAAPPGGLPTRVGWAGRTKPVGGVRTRRDEVCLKSILGCESLKYGRPGLRAKRPQRLMSVARGERVRRAIGQGERARDPLTSWRIFPAARRPELLTRITFGSLLARVRRAPRERQLLGRP